MPITDRASLHRHLQWALELEHATIPPYLCAQYSIHDGTNQTVAALIRSVVMEEMLHMTLVANVLNAVGGEPRVDDPKFIPSYSTYLPHSDRKVQVQLLPFGKTALDTFLGIERPAKPSAKPQAEHYNTIGQFYAAIREALKDLAKGIGEKKLFNGKRAKQITGERYYYGGGGGIIEVTNLRSALEAIHEIAEQGEGLDHTIHDGDDQFGQVDELAHYFRFMEIRLGRRYLETDTPKSGPQGSELPVDWSAAYQMQPNPKTRSYEAQPEVHRLMQEFNRQYTRLLRALHDGFNGKPESLLNAVPLMYGLKYRAQALMAIPSGRGDGSTVGPSFEYMP